MASNLTSVLLYFFYLTNLHYVKAKPCRIRGLKTSTWVLMNPRNRRLCLFSLSYLKKLTTSPSMDQIRQIDI